MPGKIDVSIEKEINTASKWQRPKMYQVVLHNDDITTTDFVVSVLMKVFHKDSFEATSIMLEVHNNEKGVAGVYTYDIAATKKMQADQMSNERGFPLKLTLEEEV